MASKLIRFKGFYFSSTCVYIICILFSGLPSDLGITAWVWAKPWHSDTPESARNWCWPKVGRTTVGAEKIFWAMSGYVNCP